MNREVFENPDDLFDLGFEREEDGTGDRVRWVYYFKEIAVGQTGFKLVIKVTYELSIGDELDVSYRENCDYTYEAIVCMMKDQNGKELFAFTPNIYELEDINDIEYFFD